MLKKRADLHKRVSQFISMIAVVTAILTAVLFFGPREVAAQDNPQQALLGALESSNRIVVFPDPGNQPNTQILVQGLPSNARPQSVSYFGPDRALVADFANSRIFVIAPSTGTLLATITTTGVFNGTGTLAVSPDFQTALVVGNNTTLGVIRAPFNASSPISTLTLPGLLDSYQTQAIVFDNSGRAFVNTRFGISVLDPPYTSIAFTMAHDVLQTSTGGLAISPDGSTLLLTRFTNAVRIYNAPFSADSVPLVRSFPAGEGIALNGIMITPDGSTAITASSGLPSRAFFVHAPFDPSSVFEDIPLPKDNSGSFEDVGISADGNLAILTGNSILATEPAVLIKAPFTAAETETSNLPVLNVDNPGRGAGAVRFVPPGLAPGLSVSKTAPPTVQVGANLTYTLTYRNTGNLPALNAVIRDPLPTGATFVSATNGGELINGEVVFNVGNVPAKGGDLTVSFTVNVELGLGQKLMNTGYSIAADGISPIFGPPVSTFVVGGSSCPTEIVSWWRGEGNTLDSISGNTGTLIGQPTYTPGVSGQAFRFTPGNGRDAVNIPSTGVFRGQAQGSIESWVQPVGAHTNESGDGGTVFTENTSADGQSRFKLYVLNDGRVGVYGAVPEIGGGVQVISAQSIPLGQWSHVAGTWDSVNGLRLYINGILAGTLESPVGAFSETDSSFIAIGSNRLSGNLIQSFNGDIDEPAVYTQALSAGEIFSIFSNSSLGKCAPLTITPPSVQMPIGGVRQFSAAGGGGNYTFSIVVNQSGGSIDPVTGSYTAGNTPGTDLVRVTDIFNAQANANVAVEELICSGGNRFISPTPSEIAIGTSPASITLADLNNDGNLDLIVANSTNPGNVSIRLGDGTGGFTVPPVPQIAVGSFPSSVAVGDFNNDGNIDLAVTNRFSNSVSIRLGDGQGGFTSPPTPQIGVTAPSAVAVGDINNDGNLDLVVTNSTNPGNVTILLGNGLGGFASPPVPQVGVGVNPVFVALGDLNNDGNLDLLVSNQSSNNVSVRLGNGKGGFSSPAVPEIVITDPASIAIADFNGDGNLDFAVSSFNSNSVQLRLGNGSGGFTSPAVPGIAIFAPRQVAVADVSNDGISDLVVSTNASNVSVQLGNGLGGFTTSDSLLIPVGPSANSIALGDINNSGKIDFLTANSTAGNASIRLNSCNVIPTSAPVSISGRVLTAEGRALANASIRLVDMEGNARLARTGAFGFYRFEGLAAGRTYFMSATRRGYEFNERAVTANEDLTGIDFISIPEGNKQ